MVAIGFKAPADARPKDLNKNKSSEVTSSSFDTFKPRANLHAGMIRKPLEPYHPNAARSRLPSPTIVMPYKNSSQIVIGDRSSFNKRQFTTTHGNNFVKPVNSMTQQNPGISAEATKRMKHRMDQ